MGESSGFSKRENKHDSMFDSFEFPSEHGQLIVLIVSRGADDNVPPWQTREQVGILKTWDSNADVTCVHPP